MKKLIFILCLVFPLSAFADLVKLRIVWNKPDVPGDEIRIFCKQSTQASYSKVATVPGNITIAEWQATMNDGESILCNMKAYKGAKESAPSETVKQTYIRPVEPISDITGGAITITRIQ